uniref:G-protein coupled receptors family 1 profile domain-containing protein n=1 Tax=Arion vulgaris TaxID=1028688 RepID=A0A0B6ZZ10_9EUPU
MKKVAGQRMNMVIYVMVKLVFMVPLVLVVLINMILYMLIWQTYKKVVVTRGLLSCHQKQEEEILRRKTCLYQTVFFVCWLPSIVLGCASFSDDYTTSKFYPGFILQVFLGPLQGVLNSIVYGWQRRSFRRALTETSSLLSSNRTSIMSISL